ncbi:MAG: hypothetical protein ACLKAM_12305, partial [Alkaliphilus sp.]
NLLDDEDTSLLKQDKYINNTHNYVMYDPTEDEMCKEYKMLPICLGGCPIKRLQNRERCIPFKHNFEKKILKFISANNKAKASECGCS